MKFEKNRFLVHGDWDMEKLMYLVFVHDSCLPRICTYDEMLKSIQRTEERGAGIDVSVILPVEVVKRLEMSVVSGDENRKIGGKKDGKA